MDLTSNSTMAFFMLSTSKIILISSCTGLASLDLVPAVAVNFFTASSSCQKTDIRKSKTFVENLQRQLKTKSRPEILYLSIVNLQGIELIGIFGEVGGAPVITSLLFVDTQEVVHGRVLVTELVQLVASDGGAHSAPRPEHPVPVCGINWNYF